MKNLILLIGLIIFSNRLLSCDCVPQNYETALKSSKVIFIGKLISKAVDSNLYVSSDFGVDLVRHWNFKVVKYYKGLSKECPVISILSTGTNCDYNFSQYPIGTEFIIYANEMNQSGWFNLLTTNQCSQTKLLSKITDKLEWSIFQDSSSWKIPIPLNPRLNIVIKEDKKEKDATNCISTPHTNSLLIILILNLLLTIYIIFRKK